MGSETSISRPPTDFINPDDFAALELDMPALEAGLTVRTRARILDPTDSYHWVEGTARRYSSGPQGEVSILIAFRDIDAELAAAELEHRASHDTLTGLLNRDEATERLTEILDSPGTHPVAVAFCDVDDFKVINDTYGHLAGDAVLQSLADSIRARVRDVDHVARFGGDEILVVLDGVRDLTDAERIADSVRRRVQAPIRYGHDLLDVTMSIGVTLVTRSPSRPCSTESTSRCTRPSATARTGCAPCRRRRCSSADQRDGAGTDSDVGCEGEPSHPTC